MVLFCGCHDQPLPCQVFDALSYEKGACMIRMLENYVGSTAFRDGLRVYLRRHMYRNAETADLWRAIGEVSHVVGAAVVVLLPVCLTLLSLHAGRVSTHELLDQAHWVPGVGV